MGRHGWLGSNGTRVGSVALSVAKSKGERAMWKKLLIISVAATGLSFAVADAQARHSTHKTGVTTHSRAALPCESADARAAHYAAGLASRQKGWMALR